MSRVTVFINGQPQSALPAEDRGLAYGDGLFETMRVERGTIPFWSLHRQRLLAGCERLRIELSAQRLDAELQLVLSSLAATGPARRVVKLVVTRGQGGRGYMPAAGLAATTVFLLSALETEPNLNSAGVSALVCAHRLPDNAALAGIKHLNRLDQVLAAMEWRDGGWQEGLLLDNRGFLVEACSRNLFLVKGSKVLTPSLTCAGVAGILRGQIIVSHAPALGLGIEEAALSVEDLLRADEAFLGNSVTGIWPLRCIGDASGWRATLKSGRIARELQTMFENSLQTDVNHVC